MNAPQSEVLILIPVRDPDTRVVTLWDIYVDEVNLENWRGSRRTISSCHKFMGVEREDPAPWEGLPRGRVVSFPSGAEVCSAADVC